MSALSDAELMDAVTGLGPVRIPHVDARMEAPDLTGEDDLRGDLDLDPDADDDEIDGAQ